MNVGQLEYADIWGLARAGLLICCVPGEVDGSPAVAVCYERPSAAHMVFAACPDDWVRRLFLVKSLVDAHELAQRAGLVTEESCG